MKRRAITCTAALLTLGLWSMTALSADDEDEKKARAEAQKAVLKLVDAMKNGKGTEVQGQIAGIKKKFEELEPIMWVYKPRDKGGIGMDKKGAGIENELNRMGGSKARPNPAKDPELKKNLIEAAHISKAIAEISDEYAQQYAKQKAAQWKTYTKEMRKAADELIEASKGGNPVQVKKAINNLNNSCNSCHTDFRND